ncbi:hypothetical protein ACEZCY_14005 [Streptacidiphilus sp. N1-12]|uniref:Uncharacterized protein n=2 Tax=Streptacidiphilus alkalitolerans TaxID=3342712 RepID=A0ABV6V9H9_9ACTN
MDDSQPTTPGVVHSEGEQQGRLLVDVVDTPHPGDWTGHRPAESAADPVLEQQVAGLVAAGFTMADLAAALQRGATLATYLTDSGTPEVAELLRNAVALKPRCCTCGARPAVYRNFAAQPFCRPCADDQQTPVDTASAQLAASEAQGWAQRLTPTATPADAISILRAHADWLDPNGTDVPPVDSLTAATLRLAAQFLEDVAPLPPLPRRRRLRPGLVGEMIETAQTLQREAAGPVDVRFVPVPTHDAELSTPIPDEGRIPALLYPGSEYASTAFTGYVNRTLPDIRALVQVGLDQEEAAAEQAAADRCEVVEVDGQPVRVHGQGDLTDVAQAAIEGLVRIGREQLEAEEAQAGTDGP